MPNPPIRFPRDPWITKATAARHFGVSTRTIDRWTTNGAPHWKLGTTTNAPIRYRIPDLETWLEAQHGGVGHKAPPTHRQTTTPTATHTETGVPDDARDRGAKGWPGQPDDDPPGAA